MGGDSDGGLFEFDQLSGSDDDTDQDPPDRPDPPDGEGSDENAPMGRTRDTAGSAPNPGNSQTPGSPEDGEASNEPAPVAAPGGDGSSSGGSSGDGSSIDDDSDTDAPDPPDPDDGSNGGTSRFSEFNPVEESQAAFDYAEKQSRAAAKSAYEHATHSLVWRYVRKYTSPEVRQRLDEVFSRRMLGSVFVGGAFSKILETSVELYFGAASVWRPVMWATIFIVSTTIFVWWDHLARRASETAEKASEAASEAAEKASEAAEKATQTAEKATEAASEATEQPQTAEEQTADVVGAGIAKATQHREAGSTGATRAGGKRPTAVRSRTRERRPNRRFENVEAVPYDEVVGASEDATTESVFEGTGFRDPAEDR